MPPIFNSILQKWMAVKSETSSLAQTLPGLPLISPRLKIRPFELEDEDRRQDWAKYTDPYFSKFNFPHRSPGVNKAMFNRLRDRIRLSIDDASSQMIGYISLKPVAGDPMAVELGICFAADQVCKGYGEEALVALLAWCTDILGLDKVMLEVDGLNKRAIRLYKHLGFVKIREYWKEEDHPNLKLQFKKNQPITTGFRLNGQCLEVLSWVMEWKKLKP